MSTAQLPDVVCIGETLVDFLPSSAGKSVAEVEAWIPCPGGSPANVAIGLSRLGVPSAMLGVVGSDEFGTFLRRALSREGVDVSHLRQTAEGRTGLVFISLSESGERAFHDFRTRSAETLLGPADVDPAFVNGSKAIHLGSNSLILPAAREATRALVEAARQSGRIVSCDPNLRLGFWPDPTPLRGVLEWLVPLCTVVKLAEDETEFVTGTSQPEEALRRLAERGVRLPIVTHGPAGASLLWKGQLARVPAPPVKAVDATGAGDGFVAAMLSQLTRRFPDAAALEDAELGELTRMATFACACASRVVQHLGAVQGLPRLEEVRALLPI